MPVMPVAHRLAISAPAALAVALLLVALAACNRGAQERGAPQASGAVCATCGTVIGDERFAGQYRLSDGTVKSFDDPVCLFRALHQEMGEAVVVRFRAYAGDRWLAGDKTWFARTPSITSPHGAGWAAFASFAEAQDAVTAAGSGEIVSYAQATQQLGAPADS
jgi:hypothetical protein